MENKKATMKRATAGIAGIVAAGKAPAYAQDMKKMKLGVIGIGSHGFASMFRNPPKDYPKQQLHHLAQLTTLKVKSIALTSYSVEAF